LWEIADVIHFGKQGTSINEALHSNLSAMKPQKTSKVKIETLEVLVGVACLHYNRR